MQERPSIIAFQQIAATCITDKDPAIVFIMATKEEKQYPSGLCCKLEDYISVFACLFIFSLVGWLAF